MVELENRDLLAKWLINGGGPGLGVSVCLCEEGGEVLVRARGSDCEWRGSVSVWQDALLAALSAKFVVGTLVLVAPDSASDEQLIESAKTAKDMLPNPIVMLRHGWQAMSRDELLRALDSTERYPRFTDWVHAQPDGSSLLAVFRHTKISQRFAMATTTGS